MKKLFLGLGLSFFLLNLISCEGKKVSESTGRMRVINASYNAGDINIDVDYNKVYETNIQYLNYSLFRDYITNRHPLQIKDASGNVLADTAITVELNKSYALVVFDSSNNIRYRIFEENFITPVGSNCKLRFLHLSNNAPAIDLVNAKSSAMIHSNFKNGDYSDFELMPSETTHFDVNETGTSNTIYSQIDKEFKAGYFYTMFLKGNQGSLGDDSLGLFVIENNGDY